MIDGFIYQQQQQKKEERKKTNTTRNISFVGELNLSINIDDHIVHDFQAIDFSFLFQFVLFILIFRGKKNETSYHNQIIRYEILKSFQKFSISSKEQNEINHIFEMRPNE